MTSPSSTAAVPRAGLRRAGYLAAAVSLAVLGGCDIGPKDTSQNGYRGTGMEQVRDRSDYEATLVDNEAPEPLAPVTDPGPPAAWQNVQVLNDISVAEFNRTMIAMTNWVSPDQGCAYCHNIANFASDTDAAGDTIYTKIVARRMIQMTRDVNANYKTHVGYTGVTCYTCHRGNPVPNGYWYFTDNDQYLRHYLDRDDVRVQSHTVAPTPANRSSINQTNYTYFLMTSQSQALGVNCTYCHNSRSWASWTDAPYTRVTALYGIRMLRQVNNEYLAPLAPVYPDYRLGPMGDAPKAQCLTCHQGAPKPLYGAQMAQHYPALWGSASWDSTAAPADTTQGISPAPQDTLLRESPSAAPPPLQPTTPPGATPPPGRSGSNR